MKLLLQHGADISAQEFLTPLHLTSSHGELEVARLRLDHVVDVGAKDEDGVRDASALVSETLDIYLLTIRLLSARVHSLGPLRKNTLC